MLISIKLSVIYGNVIFPLKRMYPEPEMSTLLSLRNVTHNSPLRLEHWQAGQKNINLVHFVTACIYILIFKQTCQTIHSFPDVSPNKVQEQCELTLVYIHKGNNSLLQYCILNFNGCEMNRMGFLICFK